MKHHVITATLGLSLLAACHGSHGTKDERDGGDIDMGANVGDGMQSPDGAPATSSDGGIPADTVSGVVLDENGVAATEMVVSVGGTVAVTGIDGHFTLPLLDSTASYDLTVVGRGNTGIQFLQRMEGLTRRDPTVHLYGIDVGVFSFAGQHLVEVTGTFTGISFPLGATQNGWLLVPEVTTFGGSPFVYAYSANSMATFDYETLWNGGSPPVTTHPEALFYDTDAMTGAVTYIGYGTTMGVFNSNGTTALGSIALTMPTTIPVSGTITLPTGSNGSYSIYFDKGHARAVLVSENTTGGPYTTSVPGGTDLDSVLDVEATIAKRTSSGIVHGLGSTATAPSLTLPTATALVQPVDAQASVTTSTPFQFLPSPQAGAHIVDLYDATTGNQYTVVTSTPMFSFPDATAIGMPLPQNGDSVSWNVSSVPVLSVDDMVAPADATIASSVPANTPLYTSMSESFSFTWGM